MEELQGSTRWHTHSTAAYIQAAWDVTRVPCYWQCTCSNVAAALLGRILCSHTPDAESSCGVAPEVMCACISILCCFF
jgi:hypothetical protein